MDELKTSPVTFLLNPSIQNIHVICREETDVILPDLFLNFYINVVFLSVPQNVGKIWTFIKLLCFDCGMGCLVTVFAINGFKENNFTINRL